MDNVQINELCRQRKEILNVTYQDIADGTGLSVDTVFKYMTRSVSKAPSVYVVGRICAFLGVSLDDYFDIPIEKDPRAEDLIVQLRTELDKRAAYIKRLQDTVTEKNKVIESQADALKSLANLLKGD